MQVIGITVVGKDRKGVVAAFTNLVFAERGNIESINQNVVLGLFGMYMEASFHDVNIADFSERLQKLASQEEMDVSIYHSQGERKIAILVTKESHCLDSLLESATAGHLQGSINVIIGTEETLGDRARKMGIPFVTVPDRNQEKAEEKILTICAKYGVDLIVLARYMRILTPNFVWRYPRRIINIHPSLLPAFPGAYAYQQAFERGTKIIGVTAHYVTENLDQGPIIFQESFTVNPDDTLPMIKSKGQELEAVTLTKAVKTHLENRLEVRWRKVYVKDA